MTTDNSRRRRSARLAAGLLVLWPAAAARGGDCPIWERHGYGIGEIDGDLIRYAGPVTVPTPIPIARRWLAAYGLSAWVGVAAVVPTVLIRRMRRRHDRRPVFAVASPLDRPAAAPYACGQEQPCRFPSK